MGRQSSCYPDRSVFTVSCDPQSIDQKIPEGDGVPPDDQSFKLAVVEFDDDGALVDRCQLAKLTHCIAEAHAKFPQGVVVVTFIHGWHHDGQWMDPHFAGFRRILASLAVRDLERVTKRRVVGVYLAWRGDPAFLSGRWRRTWL